MRKTGGFLLAVAMVLPLGLISMSTADAVGGTVCSKATGSAVFNPPLPVFSSTAKVKGILTATGTLEKCVGGGVTSGHTAFKSVKSTTGANCTTLATFDPKAAVKGTLVIKWNTGATSTIALTLKQVKGNPTTTNLSGGVTAGLFKGSKVTGQLIFLLPTDACFVKPLAKTTYKNTAIKNVIK